MNNRVLINERTLLRGLWKSSMETAKYSVSPLMAREQSVPIVLRNLFQLRRRLKTLVNNKVWGLRVIIFLLYLVKRVVMELV